MALDPNNQKFVDHFFAAIGPLKAAYRHISFNYLAVKFGDRFVIVRGRIFLSASPPAFQLERFQSRNVRAAHYTQAELGLDVPTLVQNLLAGQLDTLNDVSLYFPANEGGHHSASFIPFHPEGLTTQVRYNYLSLLGGQVDVIPQPDIDWEIKASALPFDGLNEIISQFGLGPLSDQTVNVDVVAYNVATVEAAVSKLDGTQATVSVLLANSLPTDRAAVSFRSYGPGAKTERGIVYGASMQWTDDEKLQLRRGVASFCLVMPDFRARSGFYA
jgi:hypothetical protein